MIGSIDGSYGTVTLLGSVGFVTADGRRVELNSAGQRRLLACAGLYADGRWQIYDKLFNVEGPVVAGIGQADT